ncbi:MAG: hypothetical protein R3E89_18750 [Thiolinea sp.]
MQDGNGDAISGLVPSGGDQQTVVLSGTSFDTCEGTAAFENVFAEDELAKAQVKKLTQPAPGTEFFDNADLGWEMRLTGPGGVDETRTVNAGDDFVLFSTELTAEGEYTITEKQKDGWDQTMPDGVCTFTVNYPADIGKTFSCTYENTKRAMVEVNKTVAGQIPGIGETFSFEIRKDATPEDAGSVLASGSSDAAGDVSFTCEAGTNPDCINVDGVAKLLPGGNYQLCETHLLVGWMTSLTGGFVPGAAGDPTADNSTICVQIEPALVAGETRVIEVDNTRPPGGDARTPGFWKNWSSCSKGNQDDVLDQTLAGSSILDASGNRGFLIGEPVCTRLLNSCCNPEQQGCWDWREQLERSCVQTGT